MHIPEEQVPNILRAVEHYAAYLKATNRDDRSYLALCSAPQLIAHRIRSPSSRAVK